MQALEHVEYLRVVVGIDADAVVTDGKSPLVRQRFDADVHAWPAGAPKFDGVRKQVDEDLLDLPGVGIENGHRVVRHHGPAFGDSRPENGQDPLQ